MSRVDQVAPNGDVVLVCGRPPEEIRVCSKVILLADTGLGTLIAAYQPSEGDRLEIALPEDEPEGMARLCHILHNTSSPRAPLPPSNVLISVIVLAVKYGLCRHQGVHHTVEIWITRGLGQENRCLDLNIALLVAAYCFNISHAFTIIARAILLKAENGKLRIPRGIELPRDLRALFDFLERTLDQTHKRANAFLLEQLKAELNSHEDVSTGKVTPGRQGCPTNNECTYSMARAGCLLDAYHLAGFWPSPGSLEDILSAMKKFVVRWPHVKPCSPKCGYKDIAMASTITGQINKKGRDLYLDLPVLCLHCAKNAQWYMLEREGGCNIH